MHCQEWLDHIFDRVLKSMSVYKLWNFMASSALLTTVCSTLWQTFWVKMEGLSSSSSSSSRSLSKTVSQSWKYLHYFHFKNVQQKNIYVQCKMHFICTEKCFLKRKIFHLIICGILFCCWCNISNVWFRSNPKLFRSNVIH